jgi:hypothetical protein
MGKMVMVQFPAGFLLLATRLTTPVYTAQHPIHVVRRKRPGREDEHSILYDVEVRSA